MDCGFLLKLIFLCGMILYAGCSAPSAVDERVTDAERQEKTRKVAERLVKPVFATLRAMEEYKTNKGVWLQDKEGLRQLAAHKAAPDVDMGYVKVAEVEVLDKDSAAISFDISNYKQSADARHMSLGVILTQRQDKTFKYELDLRSLLPDETGSASPDNLYGILMTSILVYVAAKMTSL